MCVFGPREPCLPELRSWLFVGAALGQAELPDEQLILWSCGQFGLPQLLALRVPLGSDSVGCRAAPADAAQPSLALLGAGGRA